MSNYEFIRQNTINPEIVHGKPAIRGMRWTVEMIIDLLGSGMSAEEIIEDHPELEKEDILAILKFAGLYLSSQPIQNINIANYADQNGLILIAKDADFRDSHYLKKTPKRLVKINLGNISKSRLHSSLKLCR